MRRRCVVGLLRGREQSRSIHSVGRFHTAFPQPFANGTISAGPPKAFFKISLVQIAGSVGGGDATQYAAYIRFAACNSRCFSSGVGTLLVAAS